MLKVWNLVQVATGDILNFYKKNSTKYFMLKVCNFVQLATGDILNFYK